MAHTIGRGRYAKETYPTRSNTIGQNGLIEIGHDYTTNTYAVGTSGEPNFGYLLPEQQPGSGDPTPLQAILDSSRLSGTGIVEVEWRVPLHYDPFGVGTITNAYFGASPAISTDGGTTWRRLDNTWQDASLSAYLNADPVEPFSIRFARIGSKAFVTWQASWNSVRFALAVYSEVPAGVGPARININPSATPDNTSFITAKAWQRNVAVGNVRVAPVGDLLAFDPVPFVGP